MRTLTLPHVALVSALAFAPISSAAAAEIKIYGATTVTFGLMKPNREKIEQMTGVKLAILPSSTTRGLIDLAQGRADIAMLAEPLESAAASVNKGQPGTVAVANLVGRHVGNAYVQFIVHPTNPLKTLDKEQLASLFSGRIKNWSELGGPNLPVLLVGEPTKLAPQVDRRAPRHHLPARPSGRAEHQPDSDHRRSSARRTQLHLDRP